MVLFLPMSVTEKDCAITKVSFCAVSSAKIEQGMLLDFP
jgi:hypothetical protein